MAESKEELRNPSLWCEELENALLLVRMEEESEKASLKLNIKKTKIMASGPITSWYIEGQKGESSDKFPLLGL